MCYYEQYPESYPIQNPDATKVKTDSLISSLSHCNLQMSLRALEMMEKMVRLRVFGLRVFLPRQSVTDPHSFVHQKNVYLPMNRISVTTNPKSDDLSRALFVLYTV